MQVLIINGSPRTMGNTGKSLNFLQELFKQKTDTKVDFIQVSKLNFTACTGCSQCFKTGSCYLKDEADQVAELLYQADIIIMGTPTYEMMLSGLLKTFIDRVHFILEQRMVNKQVLALATYENYGGKQVARSLTNLFLVSGATVHRGLSFKVPYGTKVLTDTNQKKLTRAANRMYQAAQSEQHNNIILRIVHKLIFHFGMKPFVLKQGNRYRGVVAHWEEQRLSY